MEKALGEGVDIRYVYVHYTTCHNYDCYLLYNMYISMYMCVGDIWHGLYSTTLNGAMGKCYNIIY